MTTLIIPTLCNIISAPIFEIERRKTFTQFSGRIASLYATGETVVVCAEDISNTPSTWSVNGGTAVATNSTYTTGLTNFTITNSSGGAVDITIQATDMTGGNTWELSEDGTAGNMICGLKAGLEGGDYTIVVPELSSSTLKSGLADSATQKWGLKLYTPTVFSDGASKSGTVTITAVCN